MSTAVLEAPRFVPLEDVAVLAELMVRAGLVTSPDSVRIGTNEPSFAPDYQANHRTIDRGPINSALLDKAERQWLPPFTGYESTDAQGAYRHPHYLDKQPEPPLILDLDNPPRKASSDEDPTVEPRILGHEVRRHRHKPELFKKIARGVGVLMGTVVASGGFLLIMDGIAQRSGH